MAPRTGILNLLVTDKASGRPVPARFHIKRPDGRAYVPQLPLRKGARSLPPVIVPDHFRENLHLCREGAFESAHLTEGEASFQVPAERLRIYVARGYERKPVRRTVEVKPGGVTRLRIALETLVHMPADGWYNGDMHVHFTRTKKRHDVVLAHLLAAEDLYCINNMVYKHAGLVQAHQRTMGHAETHHRLHHHHQVMAGGEEFRDDDLYGHMIAAGISKVIEPISVGHRLGRRENYPLFSQVCDWTHDQGGIAGWAHGGTLIKLHESLPVEAALRKLDFIEGIQFNHFMGFYFWYRLLNCGLRLALTGGSDFPFHSHILAPWYVNLGLDRTYVKLKPDQPFDYVAYINGIRQGHSFATNGPLLLFTVNGRGPGETIRLRRTDDVVKVFVRAVCQYPVDRVELVVNGAVQKTIDGRGGPREIAAETTLSIPESAWVAARVRGRAAPGIYGGCTEWNLHAHSSPVYVHRGRQPIRNKADATWMADYIRMIAEVYRRSGQFKNDQQRRRLKANFAAALKYYESLLR